MILKRIEPVVFVVAACITVTLLTSLNNNPEVLQNILRKLQLYHTERPQQKIYLHLDKPFYAAGDNIWFKAYVVEASLHTPDSSSRAIYVELINTAQQVLNRKMIFAPDGFSLGDFTLSDTLSEGQYRIRAYTEYMKNTGEDFFFSKDFSVLNPLNKKASTAELARDSVSLSFYPEGGNLVAAGFNRVAFKALGPGGKSMEVEGSIVDENNTVITSFKSQHAGMGLVRINPVVGKKYYARITKPYVIDRSYPLPNVNSTGYILQADATGKNIKVVVLTNDAATTDETINLVVQSRGKAYYAQQGTIKDNACLINIPKSKLPDGISQITVFDAQGRPVAERLVHHNYQGTIQLSLETDTAVYGKRKMVTVYIDAQYRNDAPASGNFSVSVYDDALIQNPDEYPLTITNYLSLTSDLKGYIENPGYYFKDTLTDTRKNLDLLMMVHGWRRFTWTDVLTDELQPLAYQHERGIPISGKVLKAGGKNPPVGSTLKILTMDGKAVRLQPDSLGRFYTDSLLYYDSMNLVFQTENHKGKKQPYQFSLNPVSSPYVSTQSFTSFASFDATPFLEQKTEEKLIENQSKVKMIEEIKVTAKREPHAKLLNPNGPGGRVVDVNKLGGNQYKNIYELLSSRIPGLMITYATSGVRTKIETLVRGQPNSIIYVVNGVVTPSDAILGISPVDVDLVEMVFNSVQYGGNVINIILKDGASISTVVEPVGINQTKVAGFYRAREFYSPNYNEKDNRYSLEDKRTTLYWEPMVITDENGRAGIAFFTGDVSSRYRIIMEGITEDGYPGAATLTFEVK